MAVYLVLVPAILSSLFTLTSQTQHSNNNDNSYLIDELHEAKLKVSRLESTLEETILNIESKSVYLKEQEELIVEMSNTIQYLQSGLLTIKDKSSHAEERISALEEEVRLLWAASRKNNFELHVLKSRAQDAEDRLEVLTSQVEKMADIVTEQWIQIQHLEQALQITKIRALESQRRAGTRCTFLKFINDLTSKHLPKVLEMLSSYIFGERSTLSLYISQSLQQLKRLLSAVKMYHHKLQGFIKRELERNEFTAPLVHKELIFFMASALILLPVMSAWMLLP